MFGSAVKVEVSLFDYSASFDFQATSSNTQRRIQNRRGGLSRKLDHAKFRPSPNLPEDVVHAYSNFFVERCGRRFKPDKIEVSAFFLDRLDIDQGINDIKERLKNLDDAIQDTKIVKQPFEYEKGHYQSFVALEETTDLILKANKSIEKGCKSIDDVAQWVCGLNKCEYRVFSK